MNRVKICGVTRPADAEAAVELGAWAIGLNYWEGSPRRCDPETAIEIASTLKRRCEIAGVFVNARLGEIASAAENAPLTMIQLHGDEGASFCSEVARKTGCKVIKAVPVRTSADVRGAEAFRTDYHLLDTKVAGKRGGTGQSFDWELLRARSSDIPMILAGGITPANAASAVAAAAPFALDVASGVESEPGVKDHAMIRELLEAVGVTAATEARAER